MSTMNAREQVRAKLAQLSEAVERATDPRQLVELESDLTTALRSLRESLATTGGTR